MIYICESKTVAFPYRVQFQFSSHTIPDKVKTDRDLKNVVIDQKFS